MPKVDYFKEEFGDMYFVRKKDFDGMLERLVKVVSDLENENFRLKTLLEQMVVARNENI